MNKLEVVEGKYRVGDRVGTSIIRSFGNTSVKMIADDKYFQGQIWQECSCGCEPVYTPTMKCEKCIEARHAKPTRMIEAFVEEISHEERKESDGSWYDFLLNLDDDSLSSDCFDFFDEFENITYREMKREFHRRNGEMSSVSIKRFLEESQECKREVADAQYFARKSY